MCLAKPRPHALVRRERKAEDAKALKQWATLVKERANWRCEICGELGRLEAHHIVKRSISSRLRYEISNGAALCVRHHKDADEHIVRLHRRDDDGRLVWTIAT